MNWSVMESALKSYPELVEAGSFMVLQRDPAVLASRMQTLQQLLNNAHLLIVRPTTQDFANTDTDTGVSGEGEQTTLKQLLVSSHMRQLATTTAVAQLRVFLGDRVQDVSDDILTAAFVHTVRDMLISGKRKGQPHVSIAYLSNWDPMKADCGGEAQLALAHALGRTSNLPGFEVYPNQLAEQLRTCVTADRFGAGGTGTHLLQLAGQMSASSIWAQCLLDFLHTDSLGSESANGFPIMSGINVPNGIISQPFTSTPQHTEDLCGGGVNAHMGGAPKLWTLPDKPADVMGAAFLETHDLLDCAPLLKFRFNSFLSDGVPARMLLQHSGMTVVTVTGKIWHSTISTGASFAESQNNWLGFDSPSGQPAVFEQLSALVAADQLSHHVGLRSAMAVAESYFPDKLANE